MKVGKFYKVTYVVRGRFTDSFIGMYEGIDDGEFADCIECPICGKDGHKRNHQFNIPYDQNGNIEDMTKQLDSCLYETQWFGTSCIKKCIIDEIGG